MMWNNIPGRGSERVLLARAGAETKNFLVVVRLFEVRLVGVQLASTIRSTRS